MKKMPACFKAVNNASFFEGNKLFAVVGASADASKFGNKVLRAYTSREFPVVPINPRTPRIENLDCKTSLEDLSKDLPAGVMMNEVGVSIITPPAVTRSVIMQGYANGARNFFLQPGTYDEAVDASCVELEGVNVIKSCVLVDLNCTHLE